MRTDLVRVSKHVMALEIIHFHLGVENVFSGLFAKMFSVPLFEEFDTGVKLVSSDQFALHFKDVINGIIPEQYEEFPLDADTKALIISRDRFLLAGEPLNQKLSIKGQLYKIDNVQKFFPETKIVFHLFVTDHVTYLESKKNSDFTNWKSSTWAPLVDGVLERISAPNELWVWGAESYEKTAKSMMVNLLGTHEPEADAFYDEYFKQDPKRGAIAKELISEDVQLELDMMYEADLSYFGQRPFRFLDCS
ncbi:MAG: hypothetical protein AAFN76_04340 [Pseudomonadota bacterium]